MLWQLSPSVITEALTALGILIVAIYFPWRDLNRRANLIGSILMIIAALWILTHSLEIGIPIASYKAYLMGLQLIWGLIAMSLWLMYIIRYSAPRKWQIGRIYTLFSIMPLLAIAAVATNHIYMLMWTDPGLDITNPYLPLEPTYSLFYWICMAYAGVLAIFGSFLILKNVVQQHNFCRWEPWTLILAAVIPLLAAFIEVAGFTQALGLTIGITPFFSGIGVILLVWSLPRFHLHKVIPVVRQTVFESIGDCVVVLNMQNRVVDLNPAAEHLAGFTSSEALGLPVEQIWPNWPSQFLLSESSSSKYDELVLTYAGEQRTYNIRIHTIVDSDNHSLNKVVLLVDITEHKQAENSLRESEQRYRTLFESAVEGILIADIETKKFKYANPAICRMLGYSQEELTQMSVSAIHPTTSLAHIIDEFNTQARGEKILSSTIPCLKKDGTIFYADINTVKAIIDGRECNIGFFVDITEHKKIQEQLMAQDRLASIGQLVSGVAHEINNPLTGVIGFSDLLLKREDLPDDVKDDLKTINDEALRTSNIVKNLLIFARKQPEGKAPLDVNESIQRILRLREHEQKINNIHVITRLAPNLPQLMGKSSQLQQVFFNIVVNAEFFMLEANKKGTLTIVTERKGDFIRISFADDGPGISEEHMKNLFNPFFTTKEVGKGTGLGLSICHGIITEHVGRIYADSKLGKGATFVVELPINEVTTSKGVSR